MLLKYAAAKTIKKDSHARTYAHAFHHKRLSKILMMNVRIMTTLIVIHAHCDGMGKFPGIAIANSYVVHHKHLEYLTIF